MRRRHSKRRSRRNKGLGGSYARFVKKHKGLYKKHKFGTAAKMIASMWRKRH